jgi:hypothetical protein
MRRRLTTRGSFACIYPLPSDLMWPLIAIRTRSGPRCKVKDRLLAALKVESGPKDRLVFDTTRPGLGVRVTAKGTRTFIAQWTDPRPASRYASRLVFGANLTIEQAREAARARLGAVAKRIDPKGRASSQARRSQTGARRDGADIRRADRGMEGAPSRASSPALCRRSRARDPLRTARPVEAAGSSYIPHRYCQCARPDH